MFGNFFRRYAWVYIPGFIFLLLYSKISAAVPEALGAAIDVVESGAADMNAVLYAAGKVALLGILVFATQFMWRVCIMSNARRLECAMRESYFSKLQSLPVSYFQKQRTGDLIAYAINDINAVRMTLGPVLAMSVRGIATALFSIFAMSNDIDGRMTLFVLLPLPVACGAVILLGSKIRTRFTKVQAMFARISGFVNESIMGAKIIKSFAREDEWNEDYGKLSDEMRDANISLVKVTSLLGPAVTVSFGISYAVSLIYGGGLVLDGAMSIGDLVAYQFYLELVRRPIVMLSRIINLIVRGTASYKRLRAVFDEPSVDEGEIEGVTAEIKEGISVRDLTFTYEGASSPALDGVSFELPAGSSIGITGQTGCGKTTLAALLLKLYEAPENSIFVDGTDICHMPAYSMRKACGYVPQDGFLFSDSISGNIAFYTEGVTEKDIEEAAHAASIDASDTSVFPDGYATEVGERGTHLSGGQKQRISLARALIRKPQLLILDDTLSAVDSITEETIKSRLRPLLEGRTSIIISQKLSAIADCDCILYMKDGKITERGTHGELVALGGDYAELWQKQSEQKGEEDAK
ncbi:MAG: ABC transporter ATP-binding protein [Ruminococcaceae bacterium]|nr:ABC transporter ATP-binding protein [Oscillospiraceae bacterium]